MSDTNTFQIYNASAGSGKTFTLVKEYLKIVLKTNDIFKFQKILAVTFTNKAAAEMKLRVIDNLRSFSSDTFLENENDMFLAISEELNIDKEILRKRASNVLKSILNSYASFSITTIDSFTYKIIKSFAFDLGLSMNFEVEMDAVSLLNEAVDVLISKIGTDKELTKILISFSLEKINEDKSWDIGFDLKEIAKLLLNENDILQVNKLQKRPIKDFIDLKKTIYKQQKNLENQFAEIGEKGLKIIAETDLQFNDFASSDFPNHFKKLAIVNLKTMNFEGRLGKNIAKDHHQYSGKATVIAKQEIDSIKDELVLLFHQSKIIYDTNYATYLLNNLIIRSLIPLAVLQSINSVLNEIKEDNNIRLNSEFNQLISTHLKEQPVAFIYEKIGEKYQHYFIDEMQDTSVMQWQNLIPLLDNALNSQNEKGEKGSLLLVGDAKQSIYRWRGGKAEQFIELTLDDKKNNPFLVKKHVENLPTNYRSYSEVIKFNNSFFQYLSKYLKNENYATLYKEGNKQLETDKKGGFVQLQFIDNGFSAEEKNEVYPSKILEIITNLKDEFLKKEICILTRTKKQGVAIANYLTENNVAIISSETLLLQNSNKVIFIINLLHYITQTENKEVKFELLIFLHKHLNLTEDKHHFITNFIDEEFVPFFEKLEKYDIYFDVTKFSSFPFYESIEHIIRCFNLVETSDAYIQFFLDVILEYTFKKNEGITTFLDFWEEKKDKLSIVIPEGNNAVRIMTIHKSKGLEFPVVIYAYDLDIYKQISPKVWYEPLDKEKYNGFDAALINYNASLKEIGSIGEELYKKQREELELDNFNLLYVALTRAEEQLYIISERKNEADEPKTYSQFYSTFLKNIGKWNAQESVFEFGSKKRISTKKETTVISREQSEFISSDWKNHNITIVANAAFDKGFEDARKYGTIIHEILAKIITASDIENAVANFVNEGIVPLEREQEILDLITKIVHHKKLNFYFSDEVAVLNEREILNDDKTLLIPDRLVFEDKKVTILDYKTGKKEKKHEIQINKYATILGNMNFDVVGKLLVYIGDEVEVLEV